MVTSCGNDASIKPTVSYWKQGLCRDVAVLTVGVKEMLFVALQSMIVDVLNLLVRQTHKRHIVFVSG